MTEKRLNGNVRAGSSASEVLKAVEGSNPSIPIKKCLLCGEKGQESLSVRIHRIWAGASVVIVALLCVTIALLSFHPYTLRFEMDNNTLEAVKTANATAAAVAARQDCSSQQWPVVNVSYGRCCYPNEKNCTSNCEYPVGEWYG